jgi:cytochrome c oxidase assembly factor CtaG
MSTPAVALLAFVGMFVAWAVVPSFLRKRASDDVREDL